MEKVVETQAPSFSKEVTAAEKPVVIEFWIKTCESCQKFKSVYEKLPEVFGDKVKFMTMNMFSSLENLKLAESYDVEATPTLKCFCKGKEIGAIVGYKTLDQVVNELEKILKYCQTTAIKR